MDKKQLEKNIWDLKYNFETQKINATLILGTAGILTFIGTFIWYRERLFFGIGISIIIIIASIMAYQKIKKNMEALLDNMNKILLK